MTVLRPGRPQRDGLFGGLIVIFVLALVRGLAGAQTSAGRVAVIVFVALVIAGLLAARQTGPPRLLASLRPTETAAGEPPAQHKPQ